MARRFRSLVSTALLLGALPAFSQDAKKGGDAPVLEPEYLSVKADKTPVRKEPDEKAKPAWRMWKYAPVELLSYRGAWARVRDFEGDEGWLPREALSPVPTAAAKADDVKVRKGPGEDRKVLWLLERGYALRVLGESGGWVEVSDLDDVSGWVRKSELWGASAPGQQGP